MDKCRLIVRALLHERVKGNTRAEHFLKFPFASVASMLLTVLPLYACSSLSSDSFAKLIM